MRIKASPVWVLQVTFLVQNNKIIQGQ